MDVAERQTGKKRVTTPGQDLFSKIPPGTQSYGDAAGAKAPVRPQAVSKRPNSYMKLIFILVDRFVCQQPRQATCLGSRTFDMKQ